MKLKPKHFDIARTIGAFVDRNVYTGFPDFVEPTREQIDLFTQVETFGRKRYESFSDSEKELVKPMMDGKANYDLTLKMVHEEIADWVKHGWGWGPPLMMTIQEVESDESMETYHKALLKIEESIREKGILNFLMDYTGFDKQEKDNIYACYMNNLNAQLRRGKSN